MPLLLCPNCNVSMQNVKRSAVELDICPSCRSVWLDRGELEKLLGEVRETASEDRGARERFDRDVDEFRRDPDDWRRRHPYDAEKRRHGYGDDDDHHRRKRRGFDIFDIFD